MHSRRTMAPKTGRSRSVCMDGFEETSLKAAPGRCVARGGVSVATPVASSVTVQTAPESEQADATCPRASNKLSRCSRAPRTGRLRSVFQDGSEEQSLKGAPERRQRATRGAAADDRCSLDSGMGGGLSSGWSRAVADPHEVSEAIEEEADASEEELGAGEDADALAVEKMHSRRTMAPKTGRSRSVCMDGFEETSLKAAPGRQRGRAARSTDRDVELIDAHSGVQPQRLSA